MILCIRRWLDGSEGQAAVWAGLTSQLGSTMARRFLRALEGYLWAVLASATRKLLRYETKCPCLGDDEALLSGIVSDITQGDRAGAINRAAEIVREADMVVIMERATQLGAVLEEIGAEPVSGAEPGALLH
ncbi:MAG: hypothetical protein AAF713_11190 [Pseudomonadota bacterium]